MPNIVPCFYCIFIDELKARVCVPQECPQLEDWLHREIDKATLRRGQSKPKHTLEVKDLAVQLYIQGALTTLQDVANQLNVRFHFNPPLSSDSVGRWVQAKGERMKETSELLWIKRRQKYGASGMSRRKRQALSDLRRTQWSNPDYKKEMSLQMSYYPPELKSRIVKLYQKGKTPSKIRSLLAEEGIYAPALVTIHQILNVNHVPKHNNNK